MDRAHALLPTPAKARLTEIERRVLASHTRVPNPARERKLVLAAAIALQIREGVVPHDVLVAVRGGGEGFHRIDLAVGRSG